MIPIDDIYTFSKKVSLDAGAVLNKNFGKLKIINDKSSAIDLCTNADIESEKVLKALLEQQFS